MADATPQWDPNGNLVGPPSYPVSASNVLATPNVTTSPGDSGAAVTEVQSLLNRLGYGPVAVSGTYDSDTTEAVSQFQNAENLPVTGAVDSNTYAAMQYRLAQLNGGAPIAAGQGNPNPLATTQGAQATGITSLLPQSVQNFLGGNRPAWQNALIYGGALLAAGGALWWLFKGKKKRTSHARGLGDGAGEKCKRSPDEEAFEAGEVVDVS